MSGMVSYLSGLAAEDIVGRDYQNRGWSLAAQRWRGKYGEIDLIARNDEEVVFVEVKKSRDFLRAAERLTRKQLKRITATASEFLEREPNGQLTPARIDVALVNETGEMQIIENALGF